MSSSLVGAALGGPDNGQLICNCVHGVLQQQITLLVICSRHSQCRYSSTERWPRDGAPSDKEV